MQAKIKVILSTTSDPVGGMPGKSWWDMLEAVGHKVQVFRGAQEGLRALANDTGDVVIVDGAIEDMAPEDLVASLALDERTRNVPLLLVEPPYGPVADGPATLIPREAAPEEVIALVEGLFQRASRARSFRNPALELSLLRWAAEQVSQGGTFQSVAESVAGEIVSRTGIAWVRLWRRDNEGRGWTVSVERGSGAPASLAAVERAASVAQTDVERLSDDQVFTVPLVLRERVEAALQLGGTARAGTDPRALAERLALFLSTALGRERESEEWATTSRELDLFYQIASATRYTLDLRHVARFVLDSLHRIVDYDVAGLLTLDAPAGLTLRKRGALSEELLGRARSHILTTLRINCGIEVPEEIESRVDALEVSDAREAPEKLRSFINIPLTVGGGVAGLIHLSSGRENAFSERHIEILNRLGCLLANSIQGMRDVLATVKGRVEQMVDHMGDGVLMLDGRGEVVALNGAARAILKLPRQSGSGLSGRELSLALGFDATTLMRAERRNVRKLVWVDGVAYQAQLSPIEDSEGSLQGGVVAFRNFTEEKRLDEMKSEFIHIVSHELKAPLVAVENAVHVLLSSRLGHVNERQREFLEHARRNVDALLGVVSEFMDLSRIESGKTRVSLAPLDLAAPIRSVVAALQPRAAEKRMALEVHVEEDLPRVYGESALIERVLVNLVGNALKFTEPGGWVGVEVLSTWEEWGSHRRRAVRVTVRDTGPGIPKDEIESIFDKFHQVERGGAEVPGTGFGLPMSRELVSAHYGRIWAESEPGHGSAFVFVIPVLSEAELFFKSLDRDVDRARRLPAPLALVLVRLSGHDRLVAELGRGQYEALLAEFTACAERAVRRSTDRIEFRRDAGEIAALLLDTPHRGGEAFAVRLGEEVRAVAARSGIDLEILRGCAVFPEEAATAVRLYELAGERAIGRA